MILLYPNKTHELLMKFDNLSTTSNILSFLTPFSEGVKDLSLDSNLTAHKAVKRSIEDHEIFTTHGICRRSNVIGQLVMDASQFLFPCTIEYSLICAAILYIMWKSTDFSFNHGQVLLKFRFLCIN